MLHLLFGEGAGLNLIGSRVGSASFPFPICRFPMNFPADLTGIARLMTKIHQTCCFSSDLRCKIGALLPVMETRAEPSATPFPFLPSITFLRLSSLLTSEKTSPIEGRDYLPIILPLISSNSTFSPAKNLKMRPSSTVFL
ncbi:hypothetical protein WN944_007817 [Citrus x changshan-huyou]|uniref:Uncharacterized protein n=1 Tax=Citrus x changshan-huyou TaxID=2935761 RepID=A0AAP0MRH6_9ROSI